MPLPSPPASVAIVGWPTFAGCPILSHLLGKGGRHATSIPARRVAYIRLPLANVGVFGGSTGLQAGEQGHPKVRALAPA